MVRPLRWAVVSLIGIGMILYLKLPSAPATSTPARELILRPLSRELHSVPKLFHQSWPSTKLPPKLERWSATCREKNPDWEWVLWTDEDNLELVKTHFPWFLDTYQRLPGGISQAAVARNMYMYIYGGVYADLDFECLRPLDELWYTSNVSTVSHSSTLPPYIPLNFGKHPPPRIAVLAGMGTDLKMSNSLPNSWMASSPGQPFWLLAIEDVVDAVLKKGHSHLLSQDLTGSAVLHDLVNRYLLEDKYKGDQLEQHVAKNPTALKTFGARLGLPHQLMVLPHYFVYPFSSGRDGDAVRMHCDASRVLFDAEKCKDLVATQHWPSYMIKYWNHT